MTNPRYNRRHYRTVGSKTTTKDFNLLEFDITKTTIIISAVSVIIGFIIGIATKKN